MGLKVLAKIVAPLAMGLAFAAIGAQSAAQRDVNSNANRPAPAISTVSPQDSTSQSTGADGNGELRSFQPPPHVTVATPPPTPKVWSWQEQVTWGANVVLAIVAYIGVMMAISLLKKIERQTAYAETAAEAAATSAHAALLNAQATIDAERPWLLVTVEPSRSMENSFTVMATNRGRTPATITATAERISIAVDERRLPAVPEYKKEEPSAPLVPIILVPGESTPIKTFCRDDVKALCDSEERYKRIETWEEKVYLYGKVAYMDLISARENQTHETNWCCWYIHGRQNSGLVLAGPTAYNSHT